MTDQEIYRKLRVDGEERDEFIDSLEGEMVHRAFEINEMMNRAFDNDYLEELDQEYNFKFEDVEKKDEEEEILEDVPNVEEPVEEVKEEVVIEETPKEEEKAEEKVEPEMPSEEDAPSYEQESNDVSFSNFEESGMGDGSLFEVDKGPVSDMALDRLMKEAELISNSAHRDGE